MLKKICIIIIVLSLSVSIHKFGKNINKWEYLNIKRVLVKGNNILGFEDVVKISGIETGRNTFDYSIKEIQDKLEEYCLIGSASVNRILPDKIIINIEEREPIAVLSLGKGRIMEIDNKGYIISKGKRVVNWNLPVITGFGAEFKNTGNRIKKKEFIDVLDLIQLMNKNYKNLYDIMAEINYKKDNSINIYLMGYKVKIKAKSDISSIKLEELMSIITYLGSRIKDINYIDLRFKDPIVKGENIKLS